MIEARLIDDAEALAALEPAWDALWRRCPAATPFQSPAWLIPWQRAFAPGPLRVAVASTEGRLTALLPFYLETASSRLLPLGISVSDYLDVLIDPACPAAGEAAARRLAETEWREWRFECLPPGSAAFALAPPFPLEDRCEAQDACPTIDLAGPALEDFAPARQRRKYRRAQAFAAERGEVRYDAGEPSETFLDTLFALHRARWRTRGETGVLADAQVQRFHRAALPRLQAAGLAQTLTVRIGGRAAGAYYGLRHGPRAYAYLGGFDPEFEAASPGALSIGAACEQAARTGATEFHFLRGQEAYKYAWGARDRINHVRIWRR